MDDISRKFCLDCYKYDFDFDFEVIDSVNRNLNTRVTAADMFYFYLD